MSMGAGTSLFGRNQNVQKAFALSLRWRATSEVNLKHTSKKESPTDSDYCAKCVWSAWGNVKRTLLMAGQQGRYRTATQGLVPALPT